MTGGVVVLTNARARPQANSATAAHAAASPSIAAPATSAVLRPVPLAALTGRTGRALKRDLQRRGNGIEV